jgi:two-component system sensor histidine kinase HydH
MPPMPPVLVIELEPPVIAELRRDLGRVQLVGLLAGSVLLAFAIAWSRNAARLAALEQKAARDERLVALGGMSSVMAHELRNPLASLKGHAQLLAEDLEGKPKAKAERVVAEAERLEALTSSLLDFVRDGPLDAGEVTPAELAARAVEHLGTARVEIDVADAPRALRGDVPRLVRAVANLVDNAWKASPDGAAVALRVVEEPGAVRIEVRDHGAGLPPGSEASIFEPFVTTRTKGTGLGLAVSRRIAEQHGGTLTAMNHPGGGALFTLRWPAGE